MRSVLGDGAQVAAPQSLGGEDFGWFLERVPGAMMRLGTRTPGGATYDLHQGNLRVDERAVGIGARLLAETAVERSPPRMTRRSAVANVPYRVGDNFDPAVAGCCTQALRT